MVSMSHLASMPRGWVSAGEGKSCSQASATIRSRLARILLMASLMELAWPWKVGKFSFLKKTMPALTGEHFSAIPMTAMSTFLVVLP